MDITPLREEDRLDYKPPTPPQSPNPNYESPSLNDVTIPPQPTPPVINSPQSAEPTIQEPDNTPLPQAFVSDFTASSQPALVSNDVKPVYIAPQSPINNQSPVQSPAAPIAENYTSNPFLNVVKGLVLILGNNPGSSLLLTLFSFLLSAIVVISGLATSIFAVTSMISNNSGGSVGEIIFFIVAYLAQLIFVGSFYALAAASVKGEKLTTRRAYSWSLKKYFSLLALMILFGLMVTIGFIVLIIPGLFILGRISLAPLVMFNEDLGPIKSIKRSWSLSKGHVNEMLGALFAGLLVGGFYGLINSATSVAPLVGRYIDLVALESSKAAKPKTHPLNFLYLLAFIVFVPFIVFGIIEAHKIDNHSTSSSGFATCKSSNQFCGSNININYNSNQNSDTFSQ
jgi:hypothetical protein